MQCRLKVQKTKFHAPLACMTFSHITDLYSIMYTVIIIQYTGNNAIEIRESYAENQIPHSIGMYDFLSSEFFSSLNFGPVIEIQALPYPYDFLSSDFFSSLNFGPVTDIQKAMHMSPPCIRTGGLKKISCNI